MVKVECFMVHQAAGGATVKGSLTLKGCIESSHISNLTDSSETDPLNLENCTRGQSRRKNSNNLV